MLVPELRKLLEDYNETDLRVLIVEMYKAMPKGLREDKDIDTLLQDAQGFLKARKAQKRKEVEVDVHSLETEINQFVDYAHKQYYFAPNNVVHKKERPKWRFKVKAYIKDLQRVPLNDLEGKIATDLLEKLYCVLCYACCYWTFNTDDAFRSVGIKQTELFEQIIIRKFALGINNEVVKSVIALIINNGLDKETLNSYLIGTLINQLKYPDARIIAINQCKQLKAELESSKPVRKKYSDSSDYQYREKNDILVEIVFCLNIKLGEYEEAIRYFKKNLSKQRDNEVALYLLLELLMEFELKDCWLSEYNKAVAKGVQPREDLIKTNQYILENDAMPEYILWND